MACKITKGYNKMSQIYNLTKHTSIVKKASLIKSCFKTKNENIKIQVFSNLI